MPLYLIELVNARHRATLSGLVYQLDNLASSSSSTIEAELGFKSKADDTYYYSGVMCNFYVAVFAYITISLILGPERFHRNLVIQITEKMKVSLEIALRFQFVGRLNKT